MAILVVFTLVGPVRAETAVMAIRPGLMCASADALAALTLSGGASRVGSSAEQPGDAALKRAGGCIDIPLGATMFASTVRRQTSIVGLDDADGRGERPFFIPNADLSFDPPNAPDENGQCQALGQRMARRRQLPGPASRTEAFVVWRAACAEAPPTGPGLVDLLCEGDVPGAAGRVFFWQKHAAGRTSTGFLPCVR